MTSLKNVLFEVPSTTQKSLGLWIESIGAFPTKPAAWAVRGRRLGAFRVLWVEHGVGWLETPLTRRISVPADCFVLLFPGLVHSYAPDVWWSERWIEFAGPIAETFERAGFLDRKRPIVELRGEVDATRQFVRVGDALREPGPLSGALAAARLHELLVLVHGLRTGLRGEADDALIHQAIRWIDARMPCRAAEARSEREPQNEDVSRDAGSCAETLEAPMETLELRPESVAAALGVGYSTLRRRFKQETGFSIKEYMLNAQLRRAKELLTYTSQPVEAIAESVGFTDPFYFSRLFRSREGASPSEFRDRRERGPAAVTIVRRRHRAGASSEPTTPA